LLANRPFFYDSNSTNENSVIYIIYGRKIIHGCWLAENNKWFPMNIHFDTNKKNKAKNASNIPKFNMVAGW
jgi:hypothetical protein